VPSYDLYLSFTGGPTLRRIERDFGSPCARALYCGVDPEVYFPENAATLWDMGYLGTYSPDRQAALERLLLEPARTWPAGRFIVAGAQYPQEVRWPGNVEHVAHLAPAQHRSFYSAQRYTLNVTRADMVRAGFSPSVRFFEAAACGTPILTDYWSGLEEFFEPGKEIAIVSSAAEALAWLHQANDEPRHRMGERARARALREHTAQSRAETLLRHLDAANATRRRRKPTEGPFRMANQRGVS
jgi:spore maturation protein CgeB